MLVCWIHGPNLDLKMKLTSFDDDSRGPKRWSNMNTTYTPFNRFSGCPWMPYEDLAARTAVPQNITWKLQAKLTFNWTAGRYSSSRFHVNFQEFTWIWLKISCWDGVTNGHGGGRWLLKWETKLLVAEVVSCSPRDHAVICTCSFLDDRVPCFCSNIDYGLQYTLRSSKSQHKECRRIMHTIWSNCMIWWCRCTWFTR